MRCETNHRRGFLVFEQIGDKTLERDLSLRERSLVEGRENPARLNQGNQILEEVGRDHLNLPQQTLLFKSLKDRNAVGRTDIQALWLGITLKQSKGLSIRFLGTFVRFDGRKQTEMGSEHSKRCSEAAQFLGVIESRELPSDGSDMCLSIELVGQQLRSQSATGICVRGHQTDAIAAGRVARDAKHRNALLRKAMNDWIELSWISRGEDNAVVRLFQSGFQALAVPLPHPRILMKGDLYVKSDGGVCSGLYSGTQGIEEMRDLLRKNNRDFDSAVELQ